MIQICIKNYRFYFFAAQEQNSFTSIPVEEKRESGGEKDMGEIILFNKNGKDHEGEEIHKMNGWDSKTMIDGYDYGWMDRQMDGWITHGGDCLP